MWPVLSWAGEGGRALDRLAAEIEGFVVYSRPPDPKKDEVVWMIDRLELGEWKPRTLAEGVCARVGPDGKRLAVFRTEPGSLKDKMTGSIWIIDADGTGERDLYTGAISLGVGACPIDFHPNNREIVFIREDGDLGAVDIEWRTVRDLDLPGTYARELQLDGYGEHLVARWQGPGDWAMLRRLVLVEPATRIVRVYAAGCSAAISPDANWMTVNHDGHERMSIVHRDIRRRAVWKAADLVGPGRGWHNWHWSNHNDYIAVEVFEKTQKQYEGPTDAWILQLSGRKATRITSGREANFPDLYVTRDLGTKQKVPQNGGAEIPLGRVPTQPYDLARVFRTKGETDHDPGTPARILRTVVDAELTGITPFDFERAGRYDRVLVEYVYAPRKVISGSLEAASLPIVVAHWAVYNGKPVPEFRVFEKGQSYRLELESWYWHPELKSVPRKMARLKNERSAWRYYDAGLGEWLRSRK
jgi:hypothetical protein